MPAAQKGFIFVLSLFALLWFVLPSIFAFGAMDNIDGSFKIEVNGKPIASVPENGEHKSQAKTGADGATFTLQDGRLRSGNWLLGRSQIEDRSFLPKKVMWFKSGEESDDLIHRVTAQKNGDAYDLRFAGAPLIERDGSIFADITGDAESKTNVILQ